METKKVLRLDDLKLLDIKGDDQILVDEETLYACVGCQGAPCQCYTCQCFALSKGDTRYQPRQ